MNMQKSYIAWQGASWRLRVDEVVLPDGTTKERGIVEHPGAVVLIPVMAEENGYQVLMIRQYRAAIEGTILELPAGTRGWGEDWLACAQRELREETGYRADNFISLGEIWPSPGGSNELMRLYVATGLTPDPLPMDVDEEIEGVPMALAELVAMAVDGRLLDSKSIVGILRVAHHVQQ